MIDHQEELVNLRKSIKQLQIALVILLGFVLGLAVWNKPAVVAHADSIPDVVTAKQFVVVDAAGNQSVVIGPVPGLNTEGLNAGADFRGLAVFTADHTPVASLGLGIPRDATQGALSLHYAELFLQSEDGKSTQAYIRSFSGPDPYPSTRLHLASQGPAYGSLPAYNAAIDDTASRNGILRTLTESGSVGGRNVGASSTLEVTLNNGSTGLINCPATSGNSNCGPVH
jgi:hypothetical protein